MKGILVAALTALISGTLVVPAQATGDVAVDPNLVVEHLRGPVTVVVVANPFRFPWVATVNHQILSGPAVPAGNQLFQQPLVPPPTVAPTSEPTVTVGGGVPAATPSPTGVAVTLLPSPGGVAHASTTCGGSRFDDLERCISDLETQVTYTKRYDIQLAYEAVCAAQLEFLALQARTDRVLADSYFWNEETRKFAERHLLRLISDGGGAAQASCSATDTGRRAMYGLHSDVATVNSARAAIDRIKGFPTDAVNDENTLAGNLTKSVTGETDPEIDEQAREDANALAAAKSKCKKPDPALAQKATTLATKASKPGSKQTQLKSQAANAKQVAAKADAAYEACLAAVPSYSERRPNGHNRKQQALARLAAITDSLKPYTGSDASYPKLYNTAVTQMLYVRAVLLNNVGLSRFFVRVNERCEGLYGAQAKTTITVQRTETEQNSVVIDCPSRAFTSFGFAFETIPQPAYSSVPSNSALPPGPPGGATPAANTVQVTSKSDLRTVPVVMFNVLLTKGEHGDSGWFGSFGIGLQQAANTGITTTDYFAGFSYSITRSLVATLGFALGQQQETLPGFEENAPLGSGSPPTRIRTRVVPFLSVTYGPR